MMRKADHDIRLTFVSVDTRILQTLQTEAHVCGSFILTRWFYFNQLEIIRFLKAVDVTRVC